MRNFFKKLASSRNGATAIEYGLIAGLISVAIIAGASSLGTSLNTQFKSISNTVANPVPAA